MRPKWGTVSEDKDGYPFLEKKNALYAALDKEAEMRRLTKEWEGPAPDPSVSFEEWMRLLRAQRRARGERDYTAGAITLREWVETKWLPAQDLAVLSIRNYKQHLNRRILPAFGHLPVNSLTDAEEIALWEKQLRTRYMDNTVSNTRSLLTTILGDACDAGLVDTNAAQRRRRRGKVAERRKGRSRKVRQWITPLQVLLLAERTAALTGRDQDLIMWITCAWCGLRWAELNAVRASKIRGGKLVVDAQLIDLRNGFLLSDPKDASFRNDDPAFFGSLDLPPFLQDLFALQIERRLRLRCECGGQCGEGDFLFLTAQGEHITHRTYVSEFPWPHAATGLVPPRQSGQAPRPVLVDMAAGWPGAVLRPAWPAAEGPDWSPPRVGGQPRHDLLLVHALAVNCPKCDAPAGQGCISKSGQEARPHTPRKQEAERRGLVTERALACWLPIRPGLTPHGLRHSLRVWMDEDDSGIPEVLKYDRLGHTMPGIGGTYAHVSEAMRRRLVERLQQWWETALDERLALSPTSTVPLLNDLLAARLKAKAEQAVSQSSPKLPLPE